MGQLVSYFIDFDLVWGAVYFPTMPLINDFLSAVNADSLKVIQSKIEPSVKYAAAGTKYQFLRQGYFCVDNDTTFEKPVFNRVVGLRDSWAKEQKK